jgi:hypothetical protein
MYYPYTMEEYHLIFFFRNVGLLGWVPGNKIVGCQHDQSRDNNLLSYLNAFSSFSSFVTSLIMKFDAVVNVLSWFRGLDITSIRRLYLPLYKCPTCRW